VTVANARWQQRLQIVFAVQFFAKILKGFQRKQVRIEISLLKDLKTKEHYRASAHQNSPFKYIITMDRDLGPQEMIHCLAHELIHVNQWLSGQMEDINGSRAHVRWKGKTYDPRDLAYAKHPWEKQAHRYDQLLANRFMKAWGRGVK
jgi:hypothetical protein